VISRKRVFRGVGFVALAVATLVIAIVAALQIPAVGTWAGRRLLGLAPLNPGYSLEARSVGGTWLGSLELRDVILRHGDTTLARVDWVRVEYNPVRLLGAPTLRSVVVRGGQITAHARDSTWDIAQAFRSSGDTASGSPLAIGRLAIEQVSLAAHRSPDSVVAIEHVTIRAHDIVLGDRTLLQLDTLAGTMTSSWNPGIPVTVGARGALARDVIRLDSLAITSSRSQVSGRVVLPRQFDDARQVGQLAVNLRASPLAMADLAPLFPALRPEGSLEADIAASATGREVTGTVDARLGEATLRLKGSTLAGVDAPVRMRLDGEFKNVDPARVLRDAAPAKLQGTVGFALDGARLAQSDGHGEIRFEQRRTRQRVAHFALTTEIRNGRAELRLRGASGAIGGLVRGWIRPFDSLPTYALGGDVTLPVADSTTIVRFDVSGQGATRNRARISGRVDLAIGGGRIRARGQVAGDSATYRLEGTIAKVALEQFVADTQLGPVSGRFTLSGRGFDPDRAQATARLDLDDIRYHDQTLRGGTVRANVRDARATVRATGAIGDGRLVMLAQAARIDSGVTFTVDSALFERMDLGALLGQPALEGPLTFRAVAEGRIAGQTRVVRARATIDTVTLRGIQVAEGRAQILIENARSHYEIALRTSGGSLHARADAANSAYRFEGSLDSLNVGALLARSDLTTDLHGHVAGSFTGPSLAGGTAHVDVALRESRFNEATLGPGTARLDVRSGQLTGRFAIDSGDARIALDLTGAMSEQQTQLAVNGSVRVLRLERWTRDTMLKGEGKARVDLRATSDSSGLQSAVGTLSADARIGTLRIDTLYAKLDPGAGLVVDTLMLRSNVARFDGAGRLALDDGSATDTFRVSGRFGDLSPLRGLLATEQLSLDSAAVAVTVTGPASRRDVAATGYARRFLYANTLVEQLDAEGTATLGNSLDAVSGKIELRGLANRSIVVRSATVTGTYDSTFTLEGKADLGHGVGIDLATAGDRSAAATTIRFERVDLTEGGRVWKLQQEATMVLATRSIRVEEFDLRTGERRVAMNGIVSFADSSDFTVQIDQLELTGLARAGLLNVPGAFNATLELRGPALSPVLAGNVFLALNEDGSSGVQSELRWTRRGLRLNASALDEDEHTFLVAGSLPWGFALAQPDNSDAGFVLLREPGDSLQLDIRGEEFDLGFFQPFLPAYTADNLRGQLFVDARVWGTPDHAAARGTASVAGLGLDAPLNGVSYRNGRVKASLEGAVVHLDTLFLETGKQQRLAANGNITLQPLTDPRLDLTGDLQDFAVANEGLLEARATGVIQIKGTLANPMITGSLVMGHTEFNAPAVAAVDVQDVTLTPEDRLEVARHFGPRVLRSADAPIRVLDRFGLDLDVRLPEQVWFRRQATPKIDIEVTGRIRVQQQPNQEMQFFGTVEPLPGRSTLDLFGRTFELTGGDIALNGPVEQARINVTAQYSPPIEGGSDDNNVVVNVRATGQLDSLGLDFSADPSMSRDDIVSYIVTGRPASDNPLIAQSSGSQGENLVLGQLTEALTDVVSRQLGFDVFQIKQEPAQGLVLTAGRYLTPRFYASLQQPLELGADARRLPGTTLGPGFELQYRLRSWLRLNMRGGSLPTGILFRGRYAY
jgi:translocation and assembly module TamB